MSPSRRSGALSPRAATALLALFAVLALLLMFLNRGTSSSAGTTTQQTSSQSATKTATTKTATTKTATTKTATSKAPSNSAPLEQKARYVLSVVDATGDAPQGYVGGRQFMNDGRGGTAPLPRTDDSGKKITYHEYDVNPYRKGVNRGPQRLVVGSDSSAYMTGDHYETWERLR